MNLFSKMVLLKHLKSLALNRKGLGMELAMLVLLVATGCSMLIVTTAMNGREILMEKEQEVIERLAIDDFVGSILTNEDQFASLNDGTKSELENDSGVLKCVKIEEYKFQVLTCADDIPLLDFVIKVDGTNKTITSWTYLNPKTGE